MAFIGAVGDDDFGAAARRLYLAEGIAFEGLATVPVPTGVALIVVDEDGENQIAVAPGANREVSASLVEAQSEIIERADVLLGQLETPVEAFLAAARIARSSGTRVVLNPAPADDVPDELWDVVDVVTPNQHELEALTGVENPEWAANALRNRGPTDVIATRGPFGVTWTGEDGSVRFPAITVDAVDSTGAGDAFNAGLAVGLAETGRLDDGIALGIRSGAYAVTTLGVLDGLAAREALDERFPP